ncbi:nuclear transport factor 2 family protein [Mycolicibacterium grossiae]|uniref:nuclear transport factor 2 family protein n=1 Tax=Mycolicibacterium grossiae TaxID=1552759 RepID=UPI000F78BD45|nr:nuclear transport factor 2 family protein [Mycolicibacterium grossiae]QEM43571.1 hypothetical protein FZ046_01180 [Mycolicibacterium grossiae]
MFASVGRGDHAKVLAAMAPDVHHWFAGSHALGGTRHDRLTVQRWFERLHRLCPKMAFEVHGVTVSGWPWRMTVAAEWTAHVTPARGPVYRNDGVHIMDVKFGRVHRLFAYENGEAVAEACDLMAALGVSEAGAPPICS